MDQLDVLVVGSGAAGLAAAISARENGASSVLIAEAAHEVGGSSRLSGGLVMGAGTRFQRAQDIEDSPAALFRDYMTLNRWAVDPGPVRRLADLAGQTVEWVADHGVEFYDELVFGGGESVPRVHVPVGGGEHIVDVLARTCRKVGGIDIALGRRVDRLLTEDGRVIGAAVGDDDAIAGSVILTTGGFGAESRLLAEHFPAAGRIDGAWYIGSDGARGDALTLGAQVEAQFVGQDRGLRLLDPGFRREFEAFLPGWLVVVNGAGQRFMDETAPYGIVDVLMREQSDVAYAIFDSTNIAGATTGKQARYKQVLPSWTTKQSPNWNSDMIAEQVERGKVHAAATVEELARKAGLPVEQLAGTIRRYNRLAEAGEDRDYLKAPQFLDPLVSPPFYAARMQPAVVCSTSYGPRIDRNAQVLGANGQEIPGLFAAGECTGGVLGPCYVGSGNNYANALVFGRVAGEAAALGIETRQPA